MGGGSSVATGSGCLTNNGMPFFPFPASPEVLPYTDTHPTKIQVRASNLIGSCVFHESDESTLECGGSGGDQSKIRTFELSPNEHVVRVYFRQLVEDPPAGSSAGRAQVQAQLCGIQFETNLKRKSAAFLIFNDDKKEKNLIEWQKKNGFISEDRKTNWVYTARRGHRVVGYRVSSSWGEHGCPVIQHFLEQQLWPEGSIEQCGSWFKPFCFTPDINTPPVHELVQDQEERLHGGTFPKLRSLQVSFSNSLVSNTVFKFAGEKSMVCGNVREESELRGVTESVNISPDTFVRRVFFRQCTQLCGIMFETNFGQLCKLSWLHVDTRSEAKLQQIQNGFGKHDSHSNFVYTAQPGMQVVGYKVAKDSANDTLNCPVIVEFFEAPIAPSDHLLSHDLGFQPFVSSPPTEQRPPSNKRVSKILVKKYHNLIDSSEFMFDDGTSILCGGRSGAVQKHFILEPGEYVSRVFFRQSFDRLLGVQFETSAGRFGDYLLLEHHGWQTKDGLLKAPPGNNVDENIQLNWVYCASKGCQIIGYNTDRSSDHGVGNAAVIKNFIEQPLPETSGA